MGTDKKRETVERRFCRLSARSNRLANLSEQDCKKKKHNLRLDLRRMGRRPNFHDLVNSSGPKTLQDLDCYARWFKLGPCVTVPE